MVKKDYPGCGRVAIVRTRPETVLEDYARLLDLAGYQEILPASKTTLLKINISWQTWYPACSTTPWQLEGVIRKLRADDYTDLVGVHNDTVVVDTADGDAQHLVQIQLLFVDESAFFACSEKRKLMSAQGSDGSGCQRRSRCKRFRRRRRRGGGGGGLRGHGWRW